MVMSRSKEYQKLLNSRRWKELRAWKLRTTPLCEQCKEEGFFRSAIDCHHIVPVESARTQEEMERICFDPSNLRALCIPCHMKVHKEMGKGTRQLTQERKKDSMERWAQLHDPNYNKNNNNGKNV